MLPRVSAGTADWGVSEVGTPGIFSWQHLYNWNDFGLHQSPVAVPNGIGDIANLNTLGLSSDIRINLDGAVTLGTLNVGDVLGKKSYLIAAGTGGSLTFNNGGTAEINKSGIGTDVITSNVALANPLKIDVADGRLVLGGLISGANGFTKEGTGTLILSGSVSNTYTGVTTLNNGITLALMQGNTINALGGTAAGQHTVINSGATFAFGNDLDNNGAGTQTVGGWGTVNEAFTITGDGYLGQGAIRKMIGRESDTLGGAITMGGAARIAADFGTLTFSGPVGVTDTLTIAGSAGFVSMTGVVSGSADITHYGLSGFRIQNNGNTFTGTINSNFGEIRADAGDTTTGNNPYDTITALNLRDSALRLVFPTGAGTAPNVANSRFSTTAPITMRSSYINLENAGFNGTAANLFDYAVAQALGTTTMTGGGNKIAARSADVGSVTLTFADLQRPNAGTTLELQIDSLSGGATADWGASAKHRIINNALEAGPTTVPLIPWAYYGGEFVEYDPVALGGNGYSKLDAGDYATNTAQGTWAAGQNIKVNSGDFTITANRTVQSLNIQGTTDRIVSGNAGTTLELSHGGLITVDDGHTISVPFLTAGAGSNYELYDIAWSFNTIRSVITDNGANPVSLTKAGGNTSRFLGANTYTGTTYLVEGMFQDIIGARNLNALGSGNLHMIGDADSQGVYENDADFTRALGAGVGEVQLTGGGGFGSGSVGFGALGAPINLNFGGAGATVTWGSTHFNPGNFTLNGGNATHVLTLVNDLDLGGEQRYIRLDGNSSAGNRGIMATISGDITNGGIVRQGAGVLFFDDAKSYTGGTVIREGEIWLRNGLGTAGANVTGNDININQSARLKIDDPASIGSRQMVILENVSDDSPVAVALGAGYGDGSQVRFNSIVSALNPTAPQTGGNNFFLVNQQTGNDRRNRVALQISANHGFSTDLLGQIKTVAPDVQVWFGADTGNGTFTGTTLTATGRDKTTAGLTWQGHFLGSGGGTLTIANSDVLTGAFPLTVGATDNTARTNIGGLVWIPNAQNYTGTVTQTVGTALTAGNLIGAGGILAVGQNGALNAANNNISLRGGEIRLGFDPANSHFGQTDTQYASRNLFVKSATAVFRTLPTGGGHFGNVTLNDFTMRMDDADRIFAVNRIGTTYMRTIFNGTPTLENGTTARSAFFDVGDDGNFHSGLGNLTFNNPITQTGTGAVTLVKRNGGVLILADDNTYNGETWIQQGRLVLTDLGAAGNAGTNIRMEMQNDRRGDLEFRFDGTGPFVVPNNIVTSGNDGGETRVITVGSFDGASSNQLVKLNGTLTIGHGGAHVTDGSGSSSIFFDGFNGYGLEIQGTTTLNRSIVLRPRGAVVTLSGVVAGAGTNVLEKSEQGTLVLSGNNTFAGGTLISNGYVVAKHDNAFGTGAVTFRGGSFAAVLASGTRTIGAAISNTATNSSQTIGGLDAGAKTFSGGIAMTSRGLSLTAVSGGDTTFTGTISGAFGITKTGNGTVILDPTSGNNTFNTGGVTVSQGTLVGEAQAAGNPFGANNAFTVANGTLRLNNNTGALNATTTTGALTINAGNAGLIVDGTGSGSNSTTFTFGSLVRSNSATLTMKGLTTDLGAATNEIVAFTSAPATSNGTIGTWAAIQESGSNAAHFAGVSGSNIVTATYTASGVDLDTAAAATDLLNISGGTLTANRSVYAFRTAAAGNVNLGGFTLNIGNPASGTAGQAGMILNGGADVTNGTVNFGTNALAVYTDDAAVSTMGAALSNFRVNTDNTLAVRMVKYGPGTLEVSNAANNFQGSIQVNQGTLSLTATNVVPTFANLNEVAGSEVIIQPGATVNLNGNNQEFGNLSGTSFVSSVLNTAGTLNLGNATLIVGRNTGDRVFSGQITGGAGSVLQKLGTSRLTLDNWNAAIPNSLGTLDIAQGLLQTFNNDQSWSTPTGFASSIPSSTTVLLRGGEWEVRTGGDGTSNFQVVPLGNSLIHSGGDSILDTDRFNSGQNKILTFNNLTLDKQRFLVTGGNSIFPRFDGTTTLASHSRIQTDSPLLLNGPITGNFTLTKTGGSNLEIGADNSAWNGGTVATDGTILFGTRVPEDASRFMAAANLFSYSATANLGSGDIVINRNTAIRINAPSNILSGSGQRVQVFGSLMGNLPRVDIGLDAPLADYNLRSTSDGALNLGLHDGFYTSTLNQSELGNGKWGLGAWDTTFYTAATLGAGVDNIFRFHGTNATLGITQTNALSGSASLWVGTPQHDNGFALGNSFGSVRLYGDQSYTGNTTIFRSDNTGDTNNFLEFFGDLATPNIDVFGSLTVRGDGRFTRDDGSQFNTVNMFPGSRLRFDYSMDVNDSMLISRLDNSNLGLATDENKWGDTTPMLLRGATVNLVNSGSRQNQERIGAMTVEQGAAVFLERNGGSGQIVLSTPSVTRVGQATFDVRENADELGGVDIQGQKFFIDNGTSMLDARGLLPVWMINPSRNTFLTYNNDFGVRNAAFTNSATTAGTGATFLAGLTATSIADYGAAVDNASLTGTANVWALRIGAAASNETTLTNGQINIHSGGLIVDNNNAVGRVNFSTTAVYFGDGTTPTEGVVFSDAANVTTLFGGVVTANNLTHHGPGQLELTNVLNQITGNIQMNGGTLFANGAGTLGTASVTLAGDWLQNNNGQNLAEVRLRTNNNANTTFNNPIILAEDMAYARLFAERFTGTSTATAVATIPSLTIMGSSTLQGSSLIVNNSTGTNSANTHLIDVTGATIVNNTAPFGLHVQTQRLELSGTLSTPNGAPIIKSGDGQLRVEGNNTGWTGPVTLHRGEIAAIANSGLNFGSGDYTLNNGQIRMQSDTARAFFAEAGQDITINGALTFVSNRNGATTERNMTIGADNGGQTIRTTNGAHIRFLSEGFGDDHLIESNVIVNDSAVVVNDSAELRFQGELQGSGRLTKSGIWFLFLNENTAGGNAGFTGIWDLQRGSIVQQAVNDTLGGTGSSIIVRAGGSLSVHSTAGFGTGLGVTSVTTSTTHLPVLGVRTIANFASVLDSYNGKFVGSGFGVVSVENGQSLTTDPAMASRFGGNWFLGANFGGGALTANSIAPWGTGTQFLIGGGSSTITLNPATAGSAQFAGGNQMIIGSANNVFGFGSVTFGANGNNTYTGGTLVTRSRNMDGGYRAAGLLLQGGANGTTTNFRTPLSTGTVDVFGEARIEGGSGTAVTTGGLTNANTWVLHPGSRLRFDNSTPFTGSGTTGTHAAGTIGGGGRWADAVGITLDGAVLDMLGDNADSAANKEIIGDLTLIRGAEVVVRRQSTFGSELITSNLFRGTSNATLMLRHDADLLGDAGFTNINRFIVSSGIGGAAGQVPVTNNMVDPWIVSRSQNQFLKYDPTRGFQIITEGTAPANYITSAGGTLTMAANNGTEILNLATATATLGANLDIHALRLDRDINVSADGQFTNIILRSGGLMQAANTPTINANLLFGPSGTGDGQALIWANNNILQINGKIFASEVVKSGTSFLNVRSDQSQFTGNWIINGGGIQFLTPGAASTGEVILNGSHIADNDSAYNLTEVRYNFNSGTPDLFTWNGGPITAYDINRVYVPTASDRLQQIPSIDLRTTNAVPGTGQEGTLFFQVDGFRSTVRTGTVTLHDHYLIHVEAGSFGTGSTVGVQFGSGTGVGGLNNQGSFDLRKVGDGLLTLGDNTLSFTGNRTITVGEGSLRVTHNGAAGAAGNALKVTSTGALEIGVAGFSPTATLTQDPGSAERWAVDGARSGNYTLPQGVNLQIMVNQTGTQTIDLNGGSIMGYLPRDWEQVAVIHSLGSGVTINLTADSFLGQPYATSSNGLFDLNGTYDQGKINTTTGSNPNDPALRGSYLQIDGTIQGTGGLTKVGQDIILLNGANTYSGATIIEDGILQIGRDNALPVGTSLVMETTSAMFDLNGFDQEVASLSGDGGSVNNGAFVFNTLTVNQSTNTSYSGTIDGNIVLEKTGTGTLTLTPVTPLGDTAVGSGYRGGTILAEGTIAIAQDSALGWSRLSAISDNLRFRGGTLRGTANLTLNANRGVLLESTGGTVEADGSTTFQIGGAITGSGDFSKTGAGIVQLNSTGNTYRGATHVIEGTLRGGSAGTLAASSRHIVHGDTASGALDLGGADQTIGSLASAGATEANASVSLSGNVLTVGADRSQDAIYAGAISGTGTFRVNGAGTVQTLAGADNSAASWSTEIAKGRLVLSNGAQLGSGDVTLGVSGVSTAEDNTSLHLSGTGTIANNLVVSTANSVGSVAITSGGGDTVASGTVALGRDTFVGAEAGTRLSLTGAISGTGRITVVDGGELRLSAANTFASAAGTATDDAIDGGVIVRAGRVLLEDSAAAGAGVIELGDQTSTIATPVDRATFSSVLGTGSWNSNGDGVSAGSGGQNAAGTSGFGAFVGISSTLDGNTYTAGDVGTRVLIAGEEDHPERNGIYTIVSVSGGTMNLVRADDFEISNQMSYGAQVSVANGTHAGQTMFMHEEQIVVRNEGTQEPIRFRADVANPNVALVQNLSGLTVSNAIDINATNGSGTTTLGGSATLTTGTGEFSGTVTLRDQSAGASETRTLILTSATSDGAGITFSGTISEADTTAVTGDVLSINKTGTGVVTLGGTNTYRGSTTISEGTLAISDESNLGANPDAVAAAQLHINGGTLQTTATMSLDDSNRGITVGAGGGGINTDVSTELTISNAIVLTGDLNKSGDGALYINSTTTGSGTVEVAAGILGGTGAVSGATTIKSGAILTAGTVGGIGDLDFNGGLTLEAGSTWLVDLVESTNGASDLINVTGGALDLGGAFLDLGLSGTLTPGNSYTIATFSSLLGTFDGLNEGDFIGDYQISYGVTTANAITLTAVPEPGTLGLLGLALGGFFVRRLRRKKTAE